MTFFVRRLVPAVDRPDAALLRVLQAGHGRPLRRPIPALLGDSQEEEVGGLVQARQHGHRAGHAPLRRGAQEGKHVHAKQISVLKTKELEELNI